MLGNLRIEMKKAGISQNDLVELLDTNANTICQKLNGKREFKASEMFIIKNKFFPELSLEYLFEKK